MSVFSKEDIWIIDNCVSKKYQDKIESLVFDSIKWNFRENITSNNGLSSDEWAYGLSAGIKVDNQQITGDTDMNSMCVFNFCHPLFIESFSSVGIDIDSLYRMRMFTQIPTNSKRIVNEPHVDHPFDHMVGLYYVIDSDGDTFLYNEFYGDSDLPEVPAIENMTINSRVEPKKGRIVLFNGLRYHSSSQPKRGTRCVINTNFL